MLFGGGHQRASSGREYQGYDQPLHDPRRRLPGRVSVGGVREHWCSGTSPSQLPRVKGKVFRNLVRQLLNMAITEMKSFC